MRYERSVRYGVGSNVSGERTMCATAVGKEDIYELSAERGRTIRNLE